MNKENKFANVFYPFLVLVLSTTIIQGWFPFFSRAWVVMAVGLMATFFIYPKCLSSQHFFCFMIYVVVVFLNFILGDYYFQDSSKVITEILIVLLFPCITAYLITSSSLRLSKLIFITFFISLLITTIGTIIVDSLFPGAIRMAVSKSLSFQDYSYLSNFYKWGMSNYNLPHALPVLIPPLFAVIKTDYVKRITKFACTLLLVCIVIITWLSGATTATLLTFFMLVLCWFTKTDNNRRGNTGILITFLIFTPLAFSKKIQIALLQWIIPKFSADGSSADFAFHLESLLESAETESAAGDFGVRMDRYVISIKEFVNNIFLGTDGFVGGHSALLDHLASIGILGMIPLVAGLAYFFGFLKEKISKKYHLFFTESIIASVLMMTAKNMCNVEMWLCFATLTPIMFFLLSKNEINDKQII